MPRSKPSKCEEIRVTLGTKERMMAEELIQAQSFNQIATPIVAAISDVSFWITLGTLLALFGITVLEPKNTEDVRSWQDAIRAGIVEARREGKEGDLAGLGETFIKYFSLPGFIYQAGKVVA